MLQHPTTRALSRATGRLLAAGAVIAAAGWPAAALACGDHGDHDHHAARAVRTVRHATHDLRTVARAEDAGYAQFLTCAREPGVGAMGTHWVNGDLVGDALVDRRHPEALMFETLRDGSLRLVGAEYIVFQDAWDAGHAEPPALYGEEFHLVGAPNRYGIPAFYEMHVWAWKANPEGVFEDWNPRVTCDYAEGEPI